MTDPLNGRSIREVETELAKAREELARLRKEESEDDNVRTSRDTAIRRVKRQIMSLEGDINAYEESRRG